AGTGLGTINHTLLTLEAIRGRGVKLLGVILNGPPDANNRAAIERYGRVRVIAEVPPLNPLDPAAVSMIAAKLFPSLASLMKP
ncbi:MAG: AAA family ATPase, partial [Rhodospirillaceae bacterium]